VVARGGSDQLDVAGVRAEHGHLRGASSPAL
jgi:hypothetical protein